MCAVGGIYSQFPLEETHIYVKFLLTPVLLVVFMPSFYWKNLVFISSSHSEKLFFFTLGNSFLVGPILPKFSSKGEVETTV